MSVLLAEERTYARKTGRGMIYHDITETIGNTPLVRLGRLMKAHDVKADILAKNLALGDLRKLELARALAHEPDLLLLDEPTGGLVPQETDEMKRLLERVIASGKTLILIEHKMDMVMELCDHVVVLNFGKKICEGPPGVVQANPEVIEAYMGMETDEFADGPGA